MARGDGILARQMRSIALSSLARILFETRLDDSGLPCQWTVILSGMDDGVLEMARRSFGFGRWEAPYWFIGPEQGQGPHENGDLGLRLKAWHQLGGSTKTGG